MDFRSGLRGSAALPALSLFLAVAVFGAPCANAVEAESPYTLRWSSNSVPGKWTLEVIGAEASLTELSRTQWTPAQWQKLLVVHVEQGEALGTVGVPAVSGTYRVTANAIQFEPQFPLEAGLKYTAAFFPGRLPASQAGGVITSSFELPRADLSPSTVVTQIFPSADLLPENLLKFYVHFSAPMSRGQIYDHIHLRNEAGNDVELPFLEIDEELWNPELTRLTLFIDPGRIKRGVQPLEEIGPALEQGKRFTLVIDEHWKDGHGVRLKNGFQKKFRVGPPDREAIQPSRWKIQSPRAASREALVIQFGESIDHALAHRVIYVVDSSSSSVRGDIVLRDNEREWRFTPEQSWLSGAHTVLVQNTIEDLAGNNIGKSFEVDLFEGVQRRFTNATVKLPFAVGSESRQN